MGKRLISILLAMAILFGLSATAWADETEWGVGTVGIFSDSSEIRWEYTAEGVLTITGTGAIPENCFRARDWDQFRWEYFVHPTTIIIGEGITSIGARAFYSLPRDMVIILPSTLETIEREAFSASGRSHKVISVKFAEESHLKTIGARAFAYSGITELDLPDSLETIESGAFGDCTQLQRVDIPTGVTVGGSAFSGCTMLKSVDIPGGVELQSGAFRNCGIETLTFEQNGDIIVGSEAFSGCPVKGELTIYPNVKPNVVSSTTKAFADMGVKNEPMDLVFGGDWSNFTEPWPAFDTFDFFPGEEHDYASSSSYIDEGHFEGSFIRKIVLSDTMSVLPGRLGGTYVETVEIPGSIKAVPDYAFFGSSQLTDVVLDSGVTEIGDHAFGDCGSLVKITIPKSVETFGEKVFWILVYSYYDDIIGRYPDLTIYCYANSAAHSYALDAQAHHYHTFDFVLMDAASGSITAKVTGPDGSEIEDDYTVKWYMGTDKKYAGEGKTLRGVLVDETYYCQVLLGKSLAGQYEPPELAEIAGGSEDRTVEIKLDALPDVSLSVKATDENGNGLKNATVKVTQYFGDGYSNTVSAATDDSGVHTFTVKNFKTEITVSADGYYDRTVWAESLTNEVEKVIALAPLPEARITLTVRELGAVRPGKSVVESELTSWDGLEFEVRKGDTELSGWTAQYPYILMGESFTAAPGDTVTVTVSDSTDGHAPASVDITLNSDQTGEGYVTVTENGRLAVDSVSGVESAQLMLFDESGNLFASAVTSGGYLSAPIPDGKVTIVAMKETQLLRSVSAISKLDTIGLREGRDYTKTDIQISCGAISAIKLNVPNLDESRISYTERTGFDLNYKGSYIKGANPMIRASFTLADGYDIKDARLVVETPDGLRLLPSASMSGGGTGTFTTSDHSYELSGIGSSNVIYFYLAAEKSGHYEVTGFLRFTVDGQEVSQPIGTAVIDVTDGEIYALRSTHHTKTIISGTTLPNRTVEIYDNGVQVGTVRSNEAGVWRFEHDLAKTNVSDVCYHRLYSRTDQGNGEFVVSPERVLLFDSQIPEVLSVKAIYQAAEYNQGEVRGKGASLMFDYLDPIVEQRSYTIVDARYHDNVIHPTDYSYEINIEGDRSKVGDVTLNVFDMDGEIHTYEAVYDEAKDIWVAASTGFYVANVGVDFQYIPGAESNTNYSHYVRKDGDERDLAEHLGDYIQEEQVEIGSITQSDGSWSVPAYLRTADGNVPFFTMSIEELDYTDYAKLSGADLTAQGFVKETVTPETPILESGKTHASFDAYMKYTLEPENGRAGYTLVVPEMNSAILVMNTFEPLPDAPVESEIMLTAVGVMPAWGRAVTEMLKQVDAIPIIGTPIAALSCLADIIYINALNNDKAKQVTNGVDWNMYLNMVCKTTGQFRLSDDDFDKAMRMIDDFNASVEALRKDFERQVAYMAIRCANAIMLSAVMDKMGNAMEDYLVAELNHGLKQLPLTLEIAHSCGETAAQASLNLIIDNTDSLLDMFSSDGTDLFNSINNEYANMELKQTELIRDIVKMYRDCDRPALPKPKEPEKSPSHDYKVLIDPSGYVYEAVTSNRVADAVATVYCQGEADAWNAGEYSQVNPILTGEDGSFAWDVPAGNWQVHVAKDGYETASTDWLPVPPPQLGITIGLVSTAAPEVESVNAFTDGVHIVFSQYMVPDSVKVTVTVNGTEVMGTLEPVNSEKSPGGVTYASIYEFVPLEPLTAGQEAKVSVTAGTSYNTKALAAYESGELTVMTAPTMLEVPEVVSVQYGDDDEIVVRVHPRESTAGLTVTAKSSSEDVLMIDSSAVVDNEGKATFTVHGNLPGSVTVTFAVQGHGLGESAEILVSFDADAHKVSPVTASPASGTIASGTAVTLSTATPDADIWYTTDGTCPCDPTSTTRIHYTGPITVTADTTIIAYAVKEGYEASAKSTFQYSVRASSSGGGGGNGPSASVDLIVETVDHGGVAIDPEQPKPGDKVTLTVKPDEGYVLDTLTVTDSAGKAVALTDLGNGIYTFTMPSTDVTIQAVFRCDGGEACPSRKFTDLDAKAWYHEYTDYVITADLMRGIGGGLFDPNGTVERAQMVTVLWHMQGNPVVNFAMAYSDVTEDDWYAEAIRWATSEGIAGGYGDGMFGPTDPITREQMATMLYRYAKQYGGSGFDAGEPYELPFADAAKVSDWAVEASVWCSRKGILTGKENNLLDPAGTAKRCEMAAILMRYCQKATTGEK